MIQFAWPYVFIALPLPFFIWWYLPRSQQQSAALIVPHFARFSQLHSNATKETKSPYLFRILFISFIWSLLIISAANPQRVGELLDIPTSGRDLMLAVDISGSMREEDMLINQQRLARIVVVKYLVGEFLTQREGDRVGLILFGTNAYVQAPLTFDTKTVKQFLQEATLALAGEKTAIGDAIGLAVKRLRDRPESQRVLILLTDGENTAGNINPRKAAELAAQAGIKIHTIGIGADGRRLPFGFSRRSELDEETLNYIADTTGGQYFRARNPEELQAIYEQLDKIEAIEQDDDYIRQVQSLYYYPLAFAICLSIVILIVMSTPYLRLRRSKKEDV